MWQSLVAQMVKNLPAMRETWVWSLGWEDPLEEGMATHSSILAWRIPWAEEPGGLQSMGSQIVQHDWMTNTLPFHFITLWVLDMLRVWAPDSTERRGFPSTNKQCSDINWVSCNSTQFLHYLPRHSIMSGKLRAQSQETALLPHFRHRLQA